MYEPCHCEAEGRGNPVKYTGKFYVKKFRNRI